jgi:hypothetical protein
MSTATLLDRKTCSRCGKVKPIGAFYWRPSKGRPSPSCRSCTRLHKTSLEQSPEYVAARAAHRARPEVRERERVLKALRDRKPERVARRAEMRRTPLARLKQCRYKARGLLRRATDPARVARLEALIAMHTREIDRITRAAGLGETDRP